jgi:hypothetical protein
LQYTKQTNQVYKYPKHRITENIQNLNINASISNENLATQQHIKNARSKISVRSNKKTLCEKLVCNLAKESEDSREEFTHKQVKKIT